MVIFDTKNCVYHIRYLDGTIFGTNLELTVRSSVNFSYWYFDTNELIQQKIESPVNSSFIEVHYNAK